MVLFVAQVIMRIFININSVIMRIITMRMVIMRIVIIRIVMMRIVIMWMVILRIVIMTHDMRIVMILKPVQLVQMEDGEHDRQDVDENPDGVQHIVAVRTLRPRLRIFFRSSRY